MTQNFLRSLSQRFAKPKRHPEHEQRTFDSIAPPSQRQCLCRIQLLDLTDLNLTIGKAAMGQELYDRVFAHFGDLEGRDYFGLQFTDQFHVQHWLDPAKHVRKQVPIGPPFTFRFRVKFFTNEPANLRDELTRYLFFLQLRQDIQTGRLECPREVAIQLGALALQSEFGDANGREHSVAFVSEFRFHPSQDEQMELSILRHWKSPELAGLSPSQAEMAYLEKAKQLPLYGVDLHIVEGRDGCEYRLGLSPKGMLVLDGKQKIGLFLWEKIQRLDFRGRRISLVVEEELPPAQKGQLVQLHTFVFQHSSNRAAKHLWKCAIEFHSFYRLKFPRPSQQRRVLPPLFRLGSTFRYRGRTEYETIHRQDPTANGRRRCSSEERPIIRRASRRFAPRQAGNSNPAELGTFEEANGLPALGNQRNGIGGQLPAERSGGKPMSTEL